MNQYAPQALPSAIRQKQPPREYWRKFTGLFRGGAPPDPMRYRLDRLDDISLRTWLPAPMREEIGRGIAEGNTILSIRSSGSMTMDPWDIERASAIWCAEADGIIHRMKLWSAAIGAVEIVVTLGLLAILFGIAYSHVIASTSSLNNFIQILTPPGWTPNTKLYDLFRNKLHLASIAALCTLVITLTVMLFWSRGPRRWGMVLAITLCAPPIVLFGALGYALAHQINNYHEATLLREESEARLADLRTALQHKSIDLNHYTETFNALGKDVKAYAIAHKAIEVDAPGAAYASLLRITDHFKDTLPHPARTEETSLRQAINTRIGELSIKLGGSSAPGSSTTAATSSSLQSSQTGYVAPPPQIAQGQQNTAFHSLSDRERQAIITDIDYLIRLKQMLEGSRDQLLTRSVAHAAISAATLSGINPEIRQTLLNYVAELGKAAEAERTMAAQRVSQLKGDIHTLVNTDIKNAEAGIITKKETELRQFSEIKNSIGDVSSIIMKVKSNESDSPSNKAANATIEKINSIKQVILTAVFALLMILCANEVIFVTSIGMSILMLPLLIRSFVGSPEVPVLIVWIRNVLVVIGGLSLLYGLISMAAPA